MKTLNHFLMRLLIICFFTQNVMVAQAATNQHADMANCHDSQMIAMSLHDKHQTQINSFNSTNNQSNEDFNTCHDKRCSAMCQHACQVTTLLPTQLLMLQNSPDSPNSARPNQLTTGHAFLLLRPPAIL